MAKPQKALFRWLAAFVPLLDAESGRGNVGEERWVWVKVLHSSTRQPNQPFAMLSALCYCADQKLGVRGPLWNLDAVRWSAAHRAFSGNKGKLLLQLEVCQCINWVSQWINTGGWPSRKMGLHMLFLKYHINVQMRVSLEKTGLPFDKYS